MESSQLQSTTTATDNGVRDGRSIDWSHPPPYTWQYPAPEPHVLDSLNTAIGYSFIKDERIQRQRILVSEEESIRNEVLTAQLLVRGYRPPGSIQYWKQWMKLLTNLTPAPIILFIHCHMGRVYRQDQLIHWLRIRFEMINRKELFSIIKKNIFMFILIIL